MKKGLILLAAMAVIFILPAFSPEKERDPQIRKTEKIELGRQLFFDKTLSNPDGQACSVCHSPRTSFSDPNHAVISEGMLDGFFVPRNSQSLAYVSFVPPLHFDTIQGVWKGGLFWDGRSNTLEHQLSGPLFNIAEMNNTDTAQLVSEFLEGQFYKPYKKIYGKSKDEAVVFENLIDALVHFERSSILNEFSSRFDLYLDGKVELSESELNGLELFKGKANCIACHSMEPVGEEGRILFTDYAFHNLGVPRNEKIPFYTTSEEVNPLGRNATDLGLGPVVNDTRQNGKFRTPTLRNVQYTGPYFHNGYFSSLREVVHFFNTRDEKTVELPEVPATVERAITGHLNLTSAEEQNIVAFLLTLSDGYDAGSGN